MAQDDFRGRVTVQNTLQPSPELRITLGAYQLLQNVQACVGCIWRILQITPGKPT